MKIRNSFITNSSSSSFVISKSENKPNLTKELIKECIDEILETYKNVSNKTLVGEDNFLSHLPERFKDYKIFESSEVKEIAEAFKNECWSASGIYIPDEIHNILKRVNVGNVFRRPSMGEVETACNELARFCINKRIDPGNIFNTENLGSDEYDFAYDYYDYEFQEALRGDFVIITGENAFPYGVYDLLSDTLGTERYHLG